MQKEDIENEVLKALEEVNQLRLRDLRDQLKPKFVPFKYTTESLRVRIFEVLQKNLTTGLITRVVTQAKKKGIIRKQIRYALTSTLKANALLYGRSKIDEEEYLGKLRTYFTNLLEKGTEEEFTESLAKELSRDTEGLSQKIQSDLEWLTSINEGYFVKGWKTTLAQHFNPLLFVRKYSNLVEDLDRTVIEWRGLLWQKELYSSEAKVLVENIKQGVETLSKIARELESKIKIATFISELDSCGDEVLVKFRDDWALLLNRQSEGIVNLIQNLKAGLDLLPHPKVKNDWNTPPPVQDWGEPKYSDDTVGGTVDK